MKTAPAPIADRRLRRPTPHGYAPEWWGRSADLRPDAPTYWASTRRPLTCLAFILPVLLLYEGGVVWLGGASAAALRTGADAWLRTALLRLGLTDQWLLPLSLVGSLLAWHAAAPGPWRVRPAWLVGMLAESAVLAVALIGLSRLVDLGFARLEGQGAVLGVAAARPGPDGAVLIGYLGAGVYEEALFRLALIPLGYGLLRLLQAPKLLATTATLTGSALLFSIAHHAGAPGESFTWYAFIFRWLAGVYFGWVFIARGFGVAVGTHAAYDIFVGWLGWHF